LVQTATEAVIIERGDPFWLESQRRGIAARQPNEPRRRGVRGRAGGS
jgi:hypothetical protein